MGWCGRWEDLQRSVSIRFFFVLVALMDKLRTPDYTHPHSRLYHRWTQWQKAGWLASLCHACLQASSALPPTKWILKQQQHSTTTTDRPQQPIDQVICTRFWTVPMANWLCLAYLQANKREHMFVQFLGKWIRVVTEHLYKWLDRQFVRQKHNTATIIPESSYTKIKWIFFKAVALK